MHTLDTSDIASCLEATCRGQIDLWVSRYLAGGPWANLGLRDGLLRQRRYWLGPLLMPLDRLERCCGPEPSMEFQAPIAQWERKVSQIAAGPMAMQEGKPKVDVGDPLQLPALPGDLIVCHYQLGHTAAVNLSDHDWIAVYFRIWLRDIDERRWHLLTSIWDGWRV